VEKKILDRTEMNKIASEIKSFLDAEAEWAESQPDPLPESAAYNVFDNEVMPPAFKRKVLER
jgi:TPP-dependent pyruvate/acetoin dehydrogenase alpha subunit